MNDRTPTGPKPERESERADISKGLELLKRVRNFLRARAANPEHELRSRGSDELIDELQRLGDHDERRNGPQAA